MNTNASDAAELGYAGPTLPFAMSAALDGLLGLDLAVAGGWIGELIAPGTASVLGVPMPAFMTGLGVTLLAWAAATLAFVWLNAGTKTLWAVLALNEAWVLGTAALVAFGQHALSGVGKAILIAVAVAVAALAVAQFRALRAPASA